MFKKYHANVTSFHRQSKWRVIGRLRVLKNYTQFLEIVTVKLRFTLHGLYERAIASHVRKLC